MNSSSETFIFYSFGAGVTLVMEFMADGRLLVKGEEGEQEYLSHKESGELFDRLVTVPFEEYEVNEERYENCLVV